jgi:hypothetical protein
MFTLRVTIDFIDEIGFVGTTEHRAILGPPGQDKRIVGQSLVDNTCAAVCEERVCVFADCID